MVGCFDSTRPLSTHAIRRIDMALTDSDLRDLIRLSRTGSRPSVLARRYGTTVQAISQVLSGRIGGHRLDEMDATVQGAIAATLGQAHSLAIGALVLKCGRYDPTTMDVDARRALAM